MEIFDFLSKDAIIMDFQAKNKDDAIKKLVNFLVEIKAIEKVKSTILKVQERESLGSTALGNGVAIPHAKSKDIKKITGVLAISSKGVDFKSLDGELSHIFFLLLSPLDVSNFHLKALSIIARLLKNKFCRNDILNAKNKDEIIKIIEKETKLLVQENK
ncbi:MAG: PTS sugar transporter subunit IIA [bacterium]